MDGENLSGSNLTLTKLKAIIVGIEIVEVRAMYEKKYVMIDDNFPIIFHNTVVHRDMRCAGRITSAGFCQQDAEGTWFCYGRSGSLNMDSNPERYSKIINNFFN